MYYISFLCSVNAFFFFFNDTATTEIYTLSLHDALPISTAASVTFSGSSALVVRRSIPTANHSSTPSHGRAGAPITISRSEEHTSELQSPCNLVCRLLLEKKKKNT